MSGDAKSLLVVVNAAPYHSTRARDALDLVLTAAAFEIPLTLLFCGDAVYQLLPQQQPQAIGQKDLSATLPVLPLYDVKRIYVEQQALAERGLCVEELILPVEPLSTTAAAALFHQHDQIVSF